MKKSRRSSIRSLKPVTGKKERDIESTECADSPSAIDSHPPLVIIDFHSSSHRVRYEPRLFTLHCYPVRVHSSLSPREAASECARSEIIGTMRDSDRLVQRGSQEMCGNVWKCVAILNFARYGAGCHRNCTCTCN